MRWRRSAGDSPLRIPHPRPERPIDFGKVNVRVQDAAGPPEEIPYVAAAARCDPMQAAGITTSSRPWGADAGVPVPRPATGSRRARRQREPGVRLQDRSTFNKSRTNPRDLMMMGPRRLSCCSLSFSPAAAPVRQGTPARRGTSPMVVAASRRRPTPAPRRQAPTPRRPGPRCRRPLTLPRRRTLLPAVTRGPAPTWRTRLPFPTRSAPRAARIFPPASSRSPRCQGSCPRRTSPSTTRQPVLEPPAVGS